MADKKVPPGSRPSRGKISPRLAELAAKAGNQTQPFKKTLSAGGSKVGVSREALKESIPPAKLAAAAQARNQSADGTPNEIEKEVPRLPGLAEPKLPPLYPVFIEKIAQKVALSETTWMILEAFSNIDVTAEKVGQALRANQYLEYQFFRIFGSLKKRDKVDNLESAVVLLGMQNSRNVIMALQLIRCIRGAHFEWTSDGKLKQSPAEYLKFALRTEEAIARGKGSYSDTAYAAGFLFDALSLIAEGMIEDGPTRKRVEGFAEKVYNHGLLTAKVATEIVRVIPEFGFAKYIFSAALIHDAGKVALAILDPSYVSFVEACERLKTPRALRHFAELENFGMDHALLGGNLCYYFRIFRSIENAVLFHHEPFVLQGRSRNSHQLASLVSMASNIATHFKRVDRQDDPVMPLWLGPELGRFKVDFGVLRTALKAVQT